MDKHHFLCGISRIIGSRHGNVYSTRPAIKRYSKAEAFCQGSFKAAVYLLLCTAVYGIGNAFNSRGNTVSIRIRYRHIDRRHGSFLIVILRQLLSRFGIRRVCHVSRRKDNLRRVILHNETVCRVCNALCVRDISRCIGTSDVGDLALPVCGKDDLRPTILKLCSRSLRRAGRGRYGIGNLIRPAAFLRHRNIEDQALLSDDPVKEVRCLLLDGNFTDDRLCLVPLHGNRRGYGLIARCVHRLEGIGMHALCTVVIFRKYFLGRFGNIADFRKTTLIHFAVQLHDAHVIGIGQRNVQSRRIIPAASVRTDTFLHRCRKRRRLRINHRHLHAVLFADISQVVCKSNYIFSVFRHGKAISGEVPPFSLVLPSVLHCLNADAAMTCTVSLCIVDCRTVICSACQLNRACFPVCRYGALQLFQLRRLVVNVIHKHFCTDGIAIFIRHHEYIDTIFRHSTGSSSVAGAGSNGLYAVRRVYGLNIAGVCGGSFLRRPCKHSVLSP